MDKNVVGWFEIPAEDLDRAQNFYKPSTDSVQIYFTSPSGDCATELARVEKAGGKLLRPKTLIIDEVGYYGLLLDSEGNPIAVYFRE